MKKSLAVLLAGILCAGVVTGCSTVDIKGWQEQTVGDTVRFSTPSDWETEVFQFAELDSVRCYLEQGDSYCEVTIESYQPASPSDVESYYQTTIDSEKESLHTIGSLQKGWPKQIGGKTAFHTQIKAYMGGSSVENEINIYYLMSGNTGLSIRTTVPQWENQKELEQTVDQILQTITFS